MSMKWIEKEDDALRAGIAANLTTAKIIDAVAAFGVRRSAVAICERAKRLGLPSPLESNSEIFAEMDRAFRQALEAAHPDRIQPFRDKAFEAEKSICPISTPSRPQAAPLRSGTGCALAGGA